MLVIPATPKLWQPRRGSWWRLPRLDALFMAHIKKSASTGHMLKTSTGHLAKSCGGGPAEGCCGSPDTRSPSIVRITFTGVTKCDCWVSPGTFTVGDSVGAGNVVSYKATAEINGTWDLYPEDGTCVYLSTLTPKVKGYSHYHSGGTLTIDEICDEADLYIELDVIAKVTLADPVAALTVYSATPGYAAVQQYRSLDVDWGPSEANNCDDGITFNDSMCDSCGDPDCWSVSTGWGDRYASVFYGGSASATLIF